MTRPLSLADLWRDTLADTRALTPLALPVAAAFVLLPGVAIDLFGPPLPKTVAEMTPHVVLILLVIPALIGLIAQATVIRLALDRRRGLARSVGEALTAALRLWPLMVAVVLLSAVPVGIGMLGFIVPGLYLAGRLTPAVPLIVDGLSPMAAIERSWALTDGNGWRVIGLILMFFGWFVLVSVAASLVGAGAVVLCRAIGAAAAGPVLASTFNGLVAAEFTIVNSVAMATVYRMLKA